MTLVTDKTQISLESEIEQGLEIMVGRNVILKLREGTLYRNTLLACRMEAGMTMFTGITHKIGDELQINFALVKYIRDNRVESVMVNIDDIIEVYYLFRPDDNAIPKGFRDPIITKIHGADAFMYIKHVGGKNPHSIPEYKGDVSDYYTEILSLAQDPNLDLRRRWRAIHFYARANIIVFRGMTTTSNNSNTDHAPDADASTDTQIIGHNFIWYELMPDGKYRIAKGFDAAKSIGTCEVYIIPDTKNIIITPTYAVPNSADLIKIKSS